MELLGLIPYLALLVYLMKKINTPGDWFVACLISLLFTFLAGVFSSVLRTEDFIANPLLWPPAIVYQTMCAISAQDICNAPAYETKHVSWAFYDFMAFSACFVSYAIAVGLYTYYSDKKKVTASKESAPVTPSSSGRNRAR